MIGRWRTAAPFLTLRAQEDEDRLLNATLRLCQKADLVDADMALETFKDKFLKMQVGKSKKSFPVDIIYRVWELNTFNIK